MASDQVSNNQDHQQSTFQIRYHIISCESRSSLCLSINQSRSTIHFSDSLSFHADPDQAYVWTSINQSIIHFSDSLSFHANADQVHAWESINQDKQSIKISNLLFQFIIISRGSRSSPCLSTNQSRSAIYFQIRYHFMRIQIQSVLLMVTAALNLFWIRSSNEILLNYFLRFNFRT